MQHIARIEAKQLKVSGELENLEKKKRLTERARESREAREKSYDDYHWATLCEDAAKLKKLRVPELN